MAKSTKNVAVTEEQEVDHTAEQEQEPGTGYAGGGEGEEEEEEEAAHDPAAADPDEEEETVDEDLFAELPVLPNGVYEMELVKCASRTQTSDEKTGYRSGIEYTFEPDRGEYPNEQAVKLTVWASFYDDDKPGMKDMNRRAVKMAREAGIFPEQVVLSGKPGSAKKVKFDYDDPIGGMFKVKVTTEEYQGEKKNRVAGIKSL